MDDTALTVCKVTVIEPGGFRTKAPQGNIVQLPVHPAYERESLPSYQLRKLFDTRPAMGDPEPADCHEGGIEYLPVAGSSTPKARANSAMPSMPDQ